MKEIPEGTYSYQDGELPVIEPGKEEEIRACFKDEKESELFKTGKDYTRDLAAMIGAEYDRHYQTIVNGMEELVDSGKVKEGCEVYLEDVPILFLQNAPLVAGKWLDRQIVELAEWGALLKANGYQESEEARLLLPLDKFLRSDGQEVRQDEIKNYWSKLIKIWPKLRRFI